MGGASAPAGVTVEEGADGLVVRLRWFGVRSVVVAGVVGWVDVELVMSLSAGDFQGSRVGVAAFLLVATYWALALLVNRTELRLDGRELTSRHVPLWSPWKRSVARSAIFGIRAFRRDWETSESGGVTRGVEVEHPGGVVVLVKTDGDPEAEFIAARLNEHLWRAGPA